MIHFFLHGGNTYTETESNKKFFQEIVKNGSKVLIFPFGEGNREDELFARYKDGLLLHNPGKNISFVYASREIPLLYEQIKNADILFFSGGKVIDHLEVIDKIPNLREILQGKVVAGESAGAAMRTYSSYSSQIEDIIQGNDFLHIKMMVHWGVDRHPGLSNEERLQLLEDYGEKLPVYKIPEGEYIEFTL